MLNLIFINLHVRDYCPCGMLTLHPKLQMSKFLLKNHKTALFLFRQKFVNLQLYIISIFFTTK